MSYLQITNVKSLYDLNKGLKKDPDVIVIGPGFNDDDSDDPAPYLFSKENVYDPQDGSSERWFKHLRYPYELRSCKNAFLRDVYTRISAGMGVIFILDPNDPRNLNLCLDLLAAQYLLLFEAVNAGNPTSPLVPGEKSHSQGKHELYAPVPVGWSQAKWHQLWSNNVNSSFRWTCVWALTTDPLVRELEFESEKIIWALTRENASESKKKKAANIFGNKFWDINHTGSVENPPEYYKERIAKLQDLARGDITDHESLPLDENYIPDTREKKKLLKERDKFMKALAEHPRTMVHHDIFSYWDDFCSKIAKDEAEWSPILKMPSDAMLSPCQAKQSLGNMGCLLIAKDAKGWPIAFMRPVDSGGITVVPAFCKAPEIVEELNTFSDNSYAACGNDLVEEYFTNYRQTRLVQPAQGQNQDAFTVTIKVTEISKKDNYNNRNQTIAVTVEKNGQNVNASDGKNTRLAALSLWRFLHFYGTSRLYDGSGLAYCETNGNTEIQQYRPGTDGKDDGNLEKTGGADVWKEGISTALNKICANLGLKQWQGNRLDIFEQLPPITDPQDSTKQFQVRRLADNVTVRFCPDTETCLRELKKRTSAKVVESSTKTQITNLLQKLCDH